MSSACRWRAAESAVKAADRPERSKSPHYQRPLSRLPDSNRGPLHVLGDARWREPPALELRDQVGYVLALDLAQSLRAEARDRVQLQRPLVRRARVLVEPARRASLTSVDPRQRVLVKRRLDRWSAL